MKLLRSIHAWVGVTAAIAMAVMGVTGAVSAFRGDIVRLTLPATDGGAPPANGFGATLDALERQGVRVASVKFAPYDLAAHRVSLLDGRTAYVAPDGRTLDEWRGHNRFEEWVLTLHHEFLVGGAGEKAAGVVGLLGLGLAFSGLFLWGVPRPRRRHRLLLRGFSRPELISTHWTFGLVLAAILVVQFGTGAGLALPDVFRSAMGASRPKPPSVETIENRATWVRIMAAAQSVYPSARPRRAFAPRGEDNPYSISFQQPGDLNPEGGSVVFVDRSGRVVGTFDARKQPTLARAFNAFLGVHSGEYGGLTSRLVTALAGVGLTALALLGLTSFLRRGR